MKENNKQYYSLINSYLDNIKDQKGFFSRTNLIDFINRYATLMNQVKMDLFFDDVIKEYYQNFASNSQKELIDNYMVKIFVDKELVIDEKSVDLMPMSLDIQNIDIQSKEISGKFDELIQKTPLLSIQTFNNVVEELDQRISSIKEEYVISLTGSSKVEATYKNAENVYNSYVGLIGSYEQMKLEIQRLFNDFSELRDNLRYFREDFYYIVKICDIQNIEKEKAVKLFDFAEVKWLEYAEIKSNLDLQFLKIKDHCNTFYKFVEQNLGDNVGDIFDKHFDRIGKKIGKKSYNASSLKADLVVGGAEMAYGVIKGVMDSRAESKVVVENLKREIEHLKLSFTQDKIKLQSDIFRLIELFDTVRNVFIPVTHRFNDLFFSILKNEFSFSKILSNENVMKLIDERKNISEEKRTLGLVIRDKENICEELKWNKNEAEENRDSYKGHYDFAISQRPNEPSVLLKIFTLGFCQLYYPAYLQKWETAYLPIKKEFNRLEEELNYHSGVYKKVKQQLKEDKDRQKYIKQRLLSIDTEVKAIVSNLDYNNIFDSKIDLLKNLAHTSRLVLETSIQEELLNPENFIGSLEQLGVSIQKEAKLSIAPNEFIAEENTENIFTQINAIVSRLETLPTIDELIENFSNDAVKHNKEINKKELTSILHSLSSDIQLESYTYGGVKQKFIDKVVENTLLDYNQVLGLVDATKDYMLKMEEAYKIREEVKQLEAMNKSNDTEIANQLMVLSSVIRNKINSRKEKTTELLKNVSNENISDKDKLNTFNQFLK